MAREPRQRQLTRALNRVPTPGRSVFAGITRCACVYAPGAIIAAPADAEPVARAAAAGCAAAATAGLAALFGAAAAIIIATPSRDSPLFRAISSVLAPAFSARCGTFDTGVTTLMDLCDPLFRFGRTAIDACSAVTACDPFGVSQRSMPPAAAAEGVAGAGCAGARFRQM
jgi:hypothetical protein